MFNFLSHLRSSGTLAIAYEASNTASQIETTSWQPLFDEPFTSSWSYWPHSGPTNNQRCTKLDRTQHHWLTHNCADYNTYACAVTSLGKANLLLHLGFIACTISVTFVNLKCLLFIRAGFDTATRHTRHGQYELQVTRQLGECEISRHSVWYNPFCLQELTMKESGLRHRNVNQRHTNHWLNSSASLSPNVSVSVSKDSQKVAKRWFLPALQRNASSLMWLRQTRQISSSSIRQATTTMSFLEKVKC